MKTINNAREASQLISKIRQLHATQEVLEKRRRKTIELAQQEYETQQKVLSKEFGNLAKVLIMWANERRCGNEKTLQLKNKAILWRKQPDSLNVESEEAVLASLKELGLEEAYTSKKVSLNKTALKCAGEELLSQLPGVEVKEGEEVPYIKDASGMLPLVVKNGSQNSP